MASLKPSKGVRLEGAVLVLIVVAVGLAAGAASFTHVKEWTMTNSPDGTGVWFGWANAIITELVPTASALAIRRRRRHNRTASIGYPVTLLTLAVAASLTAQLAVARPTPFGWFVSALPALAFVGLTRLVLHSSHHPDESVTVPSVATALPATPPTATTPTTPDINPSPVSAPAQMSTSDTASIPVQPRPVAPVVSATPADMPPRRQTQPRPAPRPAASIPASADTRPSGFRPVRPTEPAASLPASTTDTTTVTASEPSQPQLPGMDLAVLAQATRIAREHLSNHGTPITAGQLAVALRISTSEASKVLASLASDHPNRLVNGHPVTTATT